MKKETLKLLTEASHNAAERMRQEAENPVARARIEKEFSAVEARAAARFDNYALGNRISGARYLALRFP